MAASSIRDIAKHAKRSARQTTNQRFKPSLVVVMNDITRINWSVSHTTQDFERQMEPQDQEDIAAYYHDLTVIAIPRTNASGDLILQQFSALEELLRCKYHEARSRRVEYNLRFSPKELIQHV